MCTARGTKKYNEHDRYPQTEYTYDGPQTTKIFFFVEFIFKNCDTASCAKCKLHSTKWTRLRNIIQIVSMMNFFENITLRRTRTQSLSETTFDECSTNNLTLDGSTSSLPNISDNISDETEALKCQIENLKLELLSAHEEINKLSIENSNLKSTLFEVTNKCELMKKTAKMLTTDVGSPNSNSKSRKFSTPLKQLNKQRAVQDISSLKEAMPTSGTQATNNNTNSKTTQTPLTEPDTHTAKTRPKICIISSNNKHNVLFTADNVFQNNCNLLHYLKSNGNTKQLLEGLGTKLKNYTMEDCCIILLGQEDFKKTNDYYDIIFHLRSIVQDIRNTNIIICLPTYKYPFDATLFNCRVETFNNLLYLDIMTHGHAYLLDSNLNLKYDDSMFNIHTGTINNLGLRTIFYDIWELFAEITHNYADVQQNGIDKYVGTSTDDNFFRN